MRRITASSRSDGERIRYGLGGIKGTGRAAIEAIVAARAERPFTDLFDFCRRVDKRSVNRRAVEALTVPALSMLSTQGAQACWRRSALRSIDRRAGRACGLASVAIR
jgi:DNA polymerase III alpha subunit